MNLRQWELSTLKNYIQKHYPLATEISLVLKFLTKHDGSLRLTGLSYPDALAKANEWNTRVVKKEKKIGKVETVLTFEAGIKMVHLLDDEAKKWEGAMMGHCVGKYEGHQGIYSLRDAKGIPHITIEVIENSLTEISGKFNKPVELDYLDYLSFFAESKNLLLEEECCHKVSCLRIDLETKSFINNHFTNVSFFHSRDHYFLNLKKPLKITNAPLTGVPKKIYQVLFLQNNLEALEKLFKINFDGVLTDQEFTGNLIYQAARKNNLALIKSLVKHKPWGVSAVISTDLLVCAIRTASENGFLELTEFLLNLRWWLPRKDKAQLIKKAAADGNTDLFKLFLTYNFPLNLIDQELFDGVCARRHYEIAGFIVDRKPLFYSIKNPYVYARESKKLHLTLADRVKNKLRFHLSTYK